MNKPEKKIKKKLLKGEYRTILGSKFLQLTKLAR